MFKTALGGDKSWGGSGPAFTISVTSSLLFLLDYRIFTSPRSLKLVFSVITQLGDIRWKYTVHPEVWKVLTWTFTCIPTASTDEDSEADLATLKDMREKAFRIVRQDTRHGLGTALVAALFRSYGTERDKDDISRAISVVDSMLTSGDRAAFNNGATLLHRFLCGIGAPSMQRAEQKTDEPLFAKELVDGSLLGQRSSKLAISATSTSVKGIDPLSEAEAVTHWDSLSTAWTSIAQHSVQDPSADLVSISVYSTIFTWRC